MIDDKLLRVCVVAALLDVKPSCVRRWILDRKISTVKLSKRAIRIPSSELERLITAGFRPARPAR
jgi:hypothetical protein